MNFLLDQQNFGNNAAFRAARITDIYNFALAVKPAVFINPFQCISKVWMPS